MPLGIQILGQFLPIAVGGFHARMTVLDFMLLQPGTQLPKAFWLVDQFMPLDLLSYSQSHLITMLGNIDAQRRKLHFNLHSCLCFTCLCLSDRPCEYELSCLRLLIPSDLCKQFLGEGHNLRFRVLTPWSLHALFYLLPMIQGILAQLAFSRGEMAEARKHADLMLDLHKEMGDQFSVTRHQSEMAHVARQMGNYREALALYRETLPDWQKIGHRGAVAHQLECMAFIARAQEQIAYDREVEGLRAGMDNKTFDLLWAEGQSMTMDQAVDFAMSEQDE